MNSTTTGNYPYCKDCIQYRYHITFEDVYGFKYTSIITEIMSLNPVMKGGNRMFMPETSLPSNEVILETLKDSISIEIKEEQRELKEEEERKEYEERKEIDRKELERKELERKEEKVKKKKDKNQILKYFIILNENRIRLRLRL